MVLLTPFPGLKIAYSEKADGNIKSDNSARKHLGQHVPKETQFIAMHLSHGTSVEVIEGETHPFIDADACFTTFARTTLHFRMGDCLPIILFDPKTKTVALIHGSWKTLLQNILELTLLKMQFTGVVLENLKVWIGPSIQACCNILHEDSAQMLMDEWKPHIHRKAGQVHLDLQSFVRETLLGHGVVKKHIIDTGLCTYHQKELFFSHRRATNEKNLAEDGRMLAATWRSDE